MEDEEASEPFAKLIQTKLDGLQKQLKNEIKKRIQLEEKVAKLDASLRSSQPRRSQTSEQPMSSYPVNTISNVERLTDTYRLMVENLYASTDLRVSTFTCHL